MKAVSGKRFCKLLQNRGWRLLRITGSHHVYGIAGNPARISVPVHGNKALKKGLQASFMKIAGIAEGDL